MPWKEVSTMSQRHEFIQFAQQPGTSLRALCRRFGIRGGCLIKKTKDPGFPMTTVGNDKSDYFHTNDTVGFPHAGHVRQASTTMPSCCVIPGLLPRKRGFCGS